MSKGECTLKQLSDALAIKGYDKFCHFDSKDFHFMDLPETGLLRLERELADKKEEYKFSLMAYPIWNGDQKPFVESYTNCVFLQGKLSILTLEFIYSNGYVTIDKQALDRLTIEQIPDRKAVLQNLRRLTA